MHETVTPLDPPGVPLRILAMQGGKQGAEITHHQLQLACPPPNTGYVRITLARQRFMSVMSRQPCRTRFAVPCRGWRTGYIKG